MKVANVRFLDANAVSMIALMLTATQVRDGTLVVDLANYFPDVAPDKALGDIHELAAALMAVAGGSDARRVFGQLGRSKPKKDVQNAIAACAYWSARAALGPQKSRDDAVGFALSVLQGMGYRKLSKRTVLDAATDKQTYALRHLEAWALDEQNTVLKPLLDKPTCLPRFATLEGMPAIRHPFAGLYFVSKKQVADVREYLRRKSPRAQMKPLRT